MAGVFLESLEILKHLLQPIVKLDDFLSIGRDPDIFWSYVSIYRLEFPESD